MNDTKSMNFFQKFAICLVLLFTLLLPLKFGTLTGIPEAAGLFPDDVLSWIIISWPTTLFPLCSGIILLIALLAFRVDVVSFNDKAFRCASLWMLLGFVSIIGAVNASVKDFVYMEVVHLFGIAAYATSVFLVIKQNPKSKYWLFTALTVGTFITILLGLEQYFWGFRETQEYFMKNVTANGIAPDGQLEARIFDNRVFATFSSCNSLAGYLLLVMPMCFVMVWKFFGRVHPPIVARSLFVPIFTILMLFVFIATKSRAAILALALAVALYSIILPVKKWLRISVGVALPVLLAAGIIYIKYSSRSFDSVYSRLDYYWVAVKIFVESPFLGSGWGDFFHGYMRLKQYLSTEAPHAPHNIVLAFASQCGIAGLITLLLVFFYPLYVAYKRSRKLIRENVFFEYVPALFLGEMAFFLHSLADVNLQVPASMAVAAMFTVCMVGNSPLHHAVRIDRKIVSFYVVITVVLLVTVLGGWHLFYGEYQMSQLIEVCTRKNKTREDFMKVSPRTVKERLRRAVEAKPYSPFPWASAADFMFTRNHLQNAEAYYYEAIKLSPQRSYLYERLFHLLSLEGRDNEAHKYLEKCKALNPMEVRSKIERGIIKLPMPELKE
ncbi:MAG: hypothetical protein GY750_10475 [Lentisphaerae bacterium]|nr:hypothetical protein [Lentisphaerota bacterium]MCP4101836.1 hypothetical protein [Lentisphaerota bacterium]